MINNVTLVGRITKDIELRKTPSGLSTCSFTVACNRRKRQEEQQADFINCVAWRQSAEFLTNYAHKGTIVGVEGRITTRNYEGQNGRVYITEVTAENVCIIGQPNTQSRDDTEINRETSEDRPTDFSLGDYSDDLPFY